jgi:hypothetical protein
MKKYEERLAVSNVSEVCLVKEPMARVLNSWVDIETTPEKAWQALIDLESWKDWNPFIPKAQGALVAGNKVSIVVKSPGLKEMAFQPMVFEIKDKEKLSWGGGSLLIGYKGIHEFYIEPLEGNRIRFRQIEKFQGPVVWFMNRMIMKTAIGYANMNDAFKKYLER